MTFSELNLNKALLNALNDLGYHQPTPIQEKTYAAVMPGKDILGIAQTGTGKTFAYLLPLLRQWQFSKERHPQILVVVPTRELGAQVVAEVEKLTKYMSVVTVGVYGGTNINTQAKTILKGASDLLVLLMDAFTELILWPAGAAAKNQNKTSTCCTILFY